jgi:predicted acylesterase/phospholipase RssA
MCEDGPLPDFHDRAPPDRYCDLILTGGVTSAIAYPSAIFALATTYRFNAIGGSSSGAGAAALAAAAEYRRRHGSSDGFRILLERTEQVSDSINGQTGLAWLFQPALQHRRLFRALVPGIAGAENKGAKVAKGVLAAYAVQWSASMVAITLLLWALLALVRVALPPAGWTLVVCVLLGAVWLALALLALAWLVWRDVARVAATDFGFCTGLARLPGAPRPPLTEWLHAFIQELAGRPKDGPPLSFADLAAAPGSPRETLGDMGPTGSTSIGLQMFTANVTQGRPYVFPLKQEDPPLYFRPREMRRLFPASVVKHMMDHSEAQVDDARSPPAPAQPPGEDCLWRLPTDHLPIVVASRMSVSFPVLFMAVPLWAACLPDPRCEAGPTTYRRCLFSDGGLCSGFPIYLFDRLVPAWPTFGISLYKLGKARPGQSPAADEGCCELEGRPIDCVVTLPKSQCEAPAERWSYVDDAAASSLNRLWRFAGAVFDTTIGWNDAMQSRLLGVRDRVVRVGLPPDIGGLNILMNRQQIRCLAELGKHAATKLLDRFAVPSDESGLATGWTEHRWVRFGVMRKCLSSTLSGLAWSADLARHAQPLPQQIRRAVDEAPLSGCAGSQLLAAQGAALQGVLVALKQAEAALASPSIAQPELPAERPVLQIRPPL